MERPQGSLVGGGERDGELLGRLGKVVSESDASELETSTHTGHKVIIDRQHLILTAQRYSEGRTE